MLLITFDVKILKLSFIGRSHGTNCDLLVPRYQNKHRLADTESLEFIVTQIKYYITSKFTQPLCIAHTHTYTRTLTRTHIHTHTHTHAQNFHYLLDFLVIFLLFFCFLAAKISSSEEDEGGVGTSSGKFSLSLLDFLVAGLISLMNEASNSGTSWRGFMTSSSSASARQAPSILRESLTPTLSCCHSPPALLSLICRGLFLFLLSGMKNYTWLRQDS